MFFFLSLPPSHISFFSFTSIGPCMWFVYREPGIANFSIDNERTKDECRRIAVSALTRDGHLTDVANDDFVLYSMASEVSSGGNSDSPRSNALFETLLSLRFGTVDVGEWERVAGSIPTFSRLVDRAQYVAAATLLALHGLSHL